MVTPTDRVSLKEHVLQQLDKLRSEILNDEVTLLNATSDYSYSDEGFNTLSVNYIIKREKPPMRIDEYLTSSLSYNPETNQWEIEGE